jgi:hypothetical protein
MDVANILHAEDRFFSALHKILFLTKQCLETKHFICPITAMQIVDW